MDEPSPDSVEPLGKHTSKLLIRSLRDIHAVEGILDTYQALCRDAVPIKARSLADIDFRRVEFELLSFCAYLATCMGPKYTALLRRHTTAKDAPERYLSHMVDDLESYFEIMGTNELRAPVLVSIDPDIRFEEGGRLSLQSRLSEYHQAAARERGREVRAFGRNVGCALDAPHYPSLELIAACQARLLLEVVGLVIQEALSH